jgi:hypothetical protein
MLGANTHLQKSASTNPLFSLLFLTYQVKIEGNRHFILEKNVSLSLNQLSQALN